MASQSTADTHSTPLRGISALLALWIGILSFAGVSPTLHSWLHGELHGESTCPSQQQHHGANHDEGHDEPSHTSQDGHYCGVIALQAAATTACQIELPARSEITRTHFEAASEAYFKSHRSHGIQARAPPVRIMI